jgi:hypothetical protein
VTTCDTATSIGAYLLGSLEYGEWVTVDEHVRECELCRADLVRLAGLPGLMGKLSVDEVMADVMNQPTLSTTMLRSPHTRRKLLATAALILAITGSVAGGLLARMTEPSPASERSASSHGVSFTGSNPTTRVSGDALLTAMSWGTEIWVKLQGVPGGVQCGLVVHTRDGQSVVAGTWSSRSSTAGSWVPASAPFRPSQIASLEVATPTKQLITLTSNVQGRTHQGLTDWSTATAKGA